VIKITEKRVYKI